MCSNAGRDHSLRLSFGLPKTAPKRVLGKQHTFWHALNWWMVLWFSFMKVPSQKQAHTTLQVFINASCKVATLAWGEVGRRDA